MCIIYNILNNRVSWKKGNLIKKIIRRRNYIFSTLPYVYQKNPSEYKQGQECQQVHGGGPATAGW